MRFAARFNHEPTEAEISVFRHMNGHDPKLVAKRLVADRFWKYAESTNDPQHAVAPLSGLEASRRNAARATQPDRPRAARHRHRPFGHRSGRLARGRRA